MGHFTHRFAKLEGSSFAQAAVLWCAGGWARWLQLCMEKSAEGTLLGLRRATSSPRSRV